MLSARWQVQQLAEHEFTKLDCPATLQAVEEGEMIGSMHGLRYRKKKVASSAGQEADASDSLFADFNGSGSLEEQRLAFKEFQAQKHEQAAGKGGAWAAVARRLKTA
jgi:hypothetical protein